MRPDLKRVPEFYHNYINQVKEKNLDDALAKNTKTLFAFLDKIPKSKRDYKYGQDKWTVKEVIQHMIDGERIFSYRALCFARRDATSLPGFEENDYVANAKTEKRSWKDLVREFKAVRRSTQLLFDSFDEGQLEANGVANNNSNYVLGIGFIIAGHCSHHMRVIKERYL